MRPDAAIHTISGVTAGAAATVLLYPIDSIKTRIQAQDGTAARKFGRVTTFRNTRHALFYTLKHEGLVALYQGMTPAVVGSSVGWGIYFGGYNLFKRNLPDNLPVKNFIAASCAGLVGTMLTAPIWLVKTQMQLQEVGSKRLYNNMTQGFVYIVRNDGFRGLFKGVVPQLFLVLNPGIQFAVYEFLKALGHASYKIKLDTILPGWLLLPSIAVSKAIATIATTPFNVIKIRMQDPRNDLPDSTVRYRSLIQSTRVIYRREGVQGFFRGVVPTILRVMPGSVVTFFTYEHLSHYLRAKYDVQNPS